MNLQKVLQDCMSDSCVSGTKHLEIFLDDSMVDIRRNGLLVLNRTVERPIFDDRGKSIRFRTLLIIWSCGHVIVRQPTFGCGSKFAERRSKVHERSELRWVKMRPAQAPNCALANILDAGRGWNDTRECGFGTSESPLTVPGPPNPRGPEQSF